MHATVDGRERDSPVQQIDQSKCRLGLPCGAGAKGLNPKGRQIRVAVERFECDHRPGRWWVTSDTPKVTLQSWTSNGHRELNLSMHARNLQVG